MSEKSKCEGAKSRDAGVKEKWSFPTVGPVFSSPAVSKDGATIFVGAQFPEPSGTGCKVYALDALNGSQKWSYSFSEEHISSPAVSKDGATIFVGTASLKLPAAHIYALDALNGSQKWSFAPRGLWHPGSGYSSPTVSKDGATIFVVLGDLYALDALNGSQKWSFAPGSLLTVHSSPTVSKDGATIFVASLDYVYALDALNGSQKWSYSFSEPLLTSPPTVSKDGATIFVGAQSVQPPLHPPAGYIYALDALNGSEKWSFAPGGWWPLLPSSPTVSKDGATIFVQSMDGYVYALAVGAMTHANRCRRNPLFAQRFLPPLYPSTSRFYLLLLLPLLYLLLYLLL